MAQQAAPVQQNATAQPSPAAVSSGEASTASGAEVNTPAKPPADVRFNDVKLADPKGKQTDATLIFSSTRPW
jgi:hypothetical protein